ncbi:MAG TPA: hypothetical protein VNW97_01825 [Candidatus Saccharimonadales bacterium]|jgi:hypothetical protein|nr:hypothetical protein [Candidatus Saccharimonadales bacterium]
MTLKNFVRRGTLILAGCALVLLAPGAYAFQQTAKLEVLKKARASYYSLKSERMSGFHCDMTPNWASLLEEQRKTQPAAIDAAVDRLKRLRFSVDVGADGAAKVTHNEITADNDQMAQGLSQIYSGMEQMTTGFFQTWTVFVVTPPLPELTTEFEMQDLPQQYSLSYKDGATDVVTLMAQDFAVSAVKVTAKDFESVIKPRFSKTAKGYLMTSYDAAYEGAGGKDKTVLRVAIEYQPVEGLQVPQKLDLKGSYNGSPFQVEVAFSGCTAARQ